MRDWFALEQAAAALRRLNRAVASFEVPDAELHEVARVATELSQRLEAGAVRQKETLAVVAADGNALEFDPFSLGGGRLHPSSIGIDFRRGDGESVMARCTVHGMFQGPAGRVHGGVVALIVDELMGMVNRVVGRRAFTARLEVNLRAPTPIDVELTFRAWEHDVDGRKVVIRAEGHANGVLIVEANALFVEVSELLHDAPP